MSGLVGWWPLHGWSGQATDLSDNDNDGTVNGATRGTWGRGGLTAYSFDGTDDYVNIDGVASSLSEPLTICAWSRHNTTSAGRVVSAGTGQFGIQYEVRNTDGYEIDLFDGSTLHVITSGDKEIEKWVFHCWTLDTDGLLQYYFQGELQGTKSTGGLPSVSTAVIGRHDSDKEYHSGSIADVRVYNRVLSPQEIRELYEWGSADYTPSSLHDGSDSGAVSRYEFTSGSVTTDSWGSNTLTDNTSAGTTTDAIEGDAKSFDGTDDYMSFGSDFLSLSQGTDWSVSFWFKLDSTQTDQYLFSAWDSSNSNSEFSIYYNGNLLSAIVQDDGSSFQSAQIDLFNKIGSWVHYSSVFDSTNSTISIYLNGAKVDTNTAWDGTYNNTSADWRIGLASDGTYPVDGKIDDVRIYDRALSDREVFDLYRWTGGRDMRKELVKK